MQDGETVITCPTEGCYHLLKRDDVMPLLPLKLQCDFAALLAERRRHKERADDEVQALVQSGRLQRCPNCGQGVEKSGDDCDHMHCLCGGDFCWVCGADYNGERGIRRVGNSAHMRSCRHWRGPGRWNVNVLSTIIIAYRGIYYIL